MRKTVYGTKIWKQEQSLALNKSNIAGLGAEDSASRLFYARNLLTNHVLLDK